MITQLGEDPFGDKIADEFAACGIGCDYVKRTREANTSLAFVALKEDGNREFSFYRKPGADMLMGAEDIQESWFSDIFGLHFCSVSLGDFPMKEAHRQAVRFASEAGALVSFDPNLRFALWEDVTALKKVVQEFAPMAHVLKVSDEELEFITGSGDIKEALPKLLTGNTRLVIYTKGSDGAECYTRKASAFAPGEKVKAPLLAESPVNLECRVKQTIRLGTHDMYLAEVAAVHADEAYLDKKGRFSLDAANPIAYSHGGYYQLGKKLGTFGYSIKK